jgi:hypothetical protein
MAALAMIVKRSVMPEVLEWLGVLVVALDGFPLVGPGTSAYIFKYRVVPDIPSWVLMIAAQSAQVDPSIALRCE